MHQGGPSRCSEIESCALWRILDATRHLAAPMRVDEVLRGTLAAFLQVLEAERGSVFLYDAKTDELFTRVAARLPETVAPDKPGDGAHVPDSTPPPDTIRFPAHKGIAGETAQKRRLINVPDCYADPRFNRDVDRQTGYLTRCLLSVPLLGVDETLVGVLQVLNKRAGPFDPNDEQLALILAAHCAVVLQKAMLLDEYVLKQKMERDLLLARQIQMSALPQQMPPLAGYELAAWSKPADQTGGDIYDSVMLGEQRLALLMADATGHGIGPALSVTQFRAMARMGLALGSDLGELMDKINLQLKTDLPAGRFVTAFVGILDSSEHRIHYHSGGQAPLLHYHADEGRAEWLEASAPPLGILARLPWIAPPPIDMEPGDLFALISDGFFEYANSTGEQFGQHRVGEVLCSGGGESLEKVLSNLCASVQAFAGSTPQEDDMTVLLVRRSCR
jgi:sigma-B regulation protein RsbU (phosphoserine phosphatase)